MTEESDLPHWLQYSIKDQLDAPVDTEIIGEIPKWLTGTLYKNGPGLYKVGVSTMKHLFDGLCVLHKFVVKDGQVKYQNKLLDTDILKRSLEANGLAIGQLAMPAAPDPRKNIFSRFFSVFQLEIPDNTVVHVVPQGDKLMAMTETTHVNIVDPETLRRTEKVELHKYIAVQMASAHPHFDEDGNMYNLGTSLIYNQAYNIIKVPPPEKGGDNPLKKATVVATIPSRWKFNIGYNHSFGMSENYFIILEQTLVTNVLKMAYVMFRAYGFEKTMDNYPNERVILHLVRRSDGKETSVRYTSEAFFCFHFINCYEEDDHVVVDMCAFDSGEVMKDVYISNIQQGKLADNPPKVRRYVLPLNVEGEAGKNLVTLRNTTATAVKQADGSILCTPDYITGGATEFVSMDLPQINYSYNARKYRYAYGTIILSSKNMLTKIDLETKTTLTWQADNQDQPGEPVFVSRPGAVEEDDGVVLSIVVPVDAGISAFLLVLDAKTFKELGRAVISPDIKVPLSFHGSFVR